MIIHLEFINNKHEHNKLASDYWLLDSSNKFVYKFKDLQTKYGLTQNQIINIVKDISIAYSSSIICISCSHSYAYTSRNDFSFNQKYVHSKWTCQDCIKRSIQLEVDRKNCFLARLRTKTEKDIDELSITELTYLITLIKHSSSGNGNIIEKVMVDNSCLLTPHPRLDYELFSDLGRNNICIISDKNLLSDIEKVGDKYYICNSYQIIREVWISDYYGFHDLYKLENNLINKIELAPNEFYQIIEKISIYECIAFLERNLQKRSITIEISERTMSLIKKLLEAIPVNIIWNIIYSSIKSTSDYILQHQGTFKSRKAPYIAAVLYNKMENYFERVLANNWELKSYNRDYNLPQSSISRLVFNAILKTDDGGFTQPINIFMKEKPENI